MIKKFFLLGTDFASFKGKPCVRLFLKTEDGRTRRLYDARFPPYFYVLPKNDFSEARKSLEKTRLADRGGKPVTVKEVGEVKRFAGCEEKRLLKVVCFHPGHVPALREACKRFGEVFEADVLFARRYLFDNGLTPFSLLEIDFDENKFVNSVKQLDPEPSVLPKLRTLAFDIETYNPSGMPNAEKDACIMIGYANGREKGVLSYGKRFSKNFVKVCENEKQMLEEFALLLREKKIDLLCSYNGDVFDLPYLRKRAEKTRALLQFGRDSSRIKSKKLGLRTVSQVGGRIHFDVFNVVSFLETIGAIKPSRLTLEKVYAEVLGGEKKEIRRFDIWKSWDAGGEEALDYLAEYCLTDAVACLELSEHFLPLEIALSKVSGLALFDASRATTGQLVEALLIRNAFARNELVPNKPRAEQIAERSLQPIQGAFVKMPLPGVYENIAVFDYKSLYPSIIISHNIDPTTLNCACCANGKAFVSPQGHRFCKKRQGLIPFVLNTVLSERGKIKQAMKKIDKNSNDYKELDARQLALKITANSFYGYSVYPRSRWYSRECGESTTAWGRQYIQETMKKGEEAGFKVLYADTDSALLQFNEGEEEKVLEFQKKINASLPEKMELELEDIYSRGIFVSKKQEADKGAKKKYALINREGKIKIRGFELVRRDWSRIARRTQREVLEILLKEGDVKKAIELVKKVVEDLKKGATPLEDCVIYTQLQKKASAYEVKSPEVSAVLKARDAGVKIPENAVVGFVIGKRGGSISEKAVIAELARDYDADYYINNQVLPAVLKILGALGVNEADIKLKGSQASLNGW